MFDPVFDADLMSAMRLDATHLDNAAVASRVKDILEYYRGKNTARGDILRILSNKQGNALDIIWTYVQLQREKELRLAKLNPQDFEEDVAKEIVAGHITIDKKNRVRQDILERKALLKKSEETKEEKQGEKIINTLSKEKLDVYSQVLNEIDSYDKELYFY